MQKTHIHADDCPATAKLLINISHNEQGMDRHLPFIERTETGVLVDWEGAAASFLSTSEKAAMQVARGLATLERTGGAGPWLDRAIINATHEVFDDALQCVGGVID